MTDLSRLPVSAQSDPKGETVRAILKAHRAVTHATAARQFWVHLSAAVGALNMRCGEVGGDRNDA
jgi:hypothetical protein